MGGDIGTVQTEVQGLEHGVGEERISSHAEAANDILSMTGPRGDALESKLRIKQAVQVLQQSNVADNLVADVAKIQMGVQGMEQGLGGERICSHLKVANGMENTGERCIQHVDGSVSHWRHTVDDHDTRREATERLVQTNVGASPSGGNDIDNAISTSPHEQNNEADNLAGDAQDMNEVEIYNFLMKDNTVNGAGGVAQPGAGALEENTNVIRSWLMDDEVSTIGIWGMGGVGKTTMLERIYKELLERPDILHHVYWVTVSQDFSIYKLQNKIARLLHLDLSSEYEIQPRAVKLSEKLVNKQKWILILDDLWESFDLHKVGIPIPLKGCKLIFTTRLEIICQQMGSKHKIKVKPFSEIETWTLFMDKLGYDIPLSLEVERIAKDVAKECAGLPIAITTMAGNLTGVDDLDEWKNTLKELKESKYSDMDEVFRILRFSYDRLYDLALQQCLLYCALFPEGQVIEREELISNLINVGIIERMESRQEAFDKGHKMLNRLEGVCLLDRIDDGNAIKMHDLIRDMAIQIRKENPSVMVNFTFDPYFSFLFWYILTTIFFLHVFVLILSNKSAHLVVEFVSRILD